MYIGILGYHDKPVFNINFWLKSMNKMYLKIKDIENLKKGESIKLLCIDRNFYDIIQSNPINIPICPKEFFKNNYIIEYTHYEDLKGFGNWCNLDKPGTKSDFEFHIEYCKNHWYPLKNGKLPESDPKGIAYLLNNSFVKKNWKNYDKNTLIGWRGPMIPFKFIDNSIYIYHN